MVMEIAIAIGAIGAALLGAGGGGYYIWKKHKHPELGHYDAVLSLNYKEICDVSKGNHQGHEDAICWQYAKEENFIEEKHDAVVAAFIGDYNQGKTFLLNHLAGTFLESKYQSRTEGLCFKKTKVQTTEKKDVNVMFIDSEGSNCLPEDASDLDELMTKTNYDKFVYTMASRLADIPIIVTEQPTQSLMQQIYEIGGIMKSKGNSNRTIIVVYNYKSIEVTKDATELFEKEVIEKFKCTKSEPAPHVSYYTHDITIKGDKFELIHLPLGHEGSEAGKHFNKNSFDAIKYQMSREQERKRDANEKKGFSIAQQVFSLAPLFKRYLGITVSGPHDLSSRSGTPSV